jgi:hypothetical protein
MMKDGAGRAIWRKLGLFLYGFVYAPGLVQEEAGDAPGRVVGVLLRICGAARSPVAGDRGSITVGASSRWAVGGFESETAT